MKCQSAQQTPFTAGCKSREFLIVALTAALFKLFYFFALSPPHNFDESRFLDEATSLLNGDGFRWNGRLETFTPPGYPVFIASVRLLFGAWDAVGWVQLCLSIASACLVYYALVPFGRKMAVVGLLGMSMNPWLNWPTSVLMSEPFGGFLASLLVFTMSRLERDGRGLWLHFLLGLISASIILTSPGLFFVVAGVGLVATWRSRRRPARVLTLYAGGILLLIPWQVHCHAAAGRVQLAIYDFSQSNMNWPAHTWHRTWMRSPTDLLCAFDFTGQRLAEHGGHAFRSSDEREYVLRLHQKLTDGDIEWNGFQDALHKLGRQRRQDEPLSYFVILPAMRSATLWLCVSPLTARPYLPFGRHRIGLLKPGFLLQKLRDQGSSAAAKATMTGVVSLGLVCLHYVYLFTFGLLCLRAVRSGNPYGWAIVLGIVLYTLASGIQAGGETRRNFVLYPVLFGLGMFAVRRKECHTSFSDV